ncbi:MAG: phosphoenolpyruvate--protein phosphotransferase [Chloroflexi bacterium]|nr:phosphoenolpyruvate--protein phosphotransferase [Chloroflexota bacterium]
MIEIKGIGASRGIGIGPIFQYRTTKIEFVTCKVDDPESELARIRAAVPVARAQLEGVYEHAQSDPSTQAEAEIFQAQLMMLEDPEFWQQVEDQVSGERTNAEAAISDVAKTYAEMLRAMDNEYFAARAADVFDVANRVLKILLGISDSPTTGLVQPSIIVAEDLTPSDTVLLDKSLVIGFCTAVGSATSHTAILARGLGLPAVAGAGQQIVELNNDVMVILDGNHGKLIVDPDPETVQQFQTRLKAAGEIKESALKMAKVPAVTQDGLRVEVVANIGNVEGAIKSLEFGAEGVGLLRTEFLYLERSNLPSEEEQYAAYRAIFEPFGSMPVVLRTLDIGGDKELPYMDMPKEMNPFLGLRALRLCLANPDLFKTQLRAALRAAVGRNVKIMFPMVATLAEIRLAKLALEECRRELSAEGKAFADEIEVGIMVEIPAAAVSADRLAREVDFFSIGTNDLSQYTMAADRTNSAVAGLTSAFQPAVLRLIHQVIQAAHAHGKWVGMCGELAGEPLAAPLLVGMGLDEFSMSAPMIPVIKQILRGLNAAEMKGLVEDALDLDSPEEIQELVRQRVPQADVQI